MFITKLNFVIITVLTCSVAAGSRILGLFATYSKSHMLLHCTVAEQLARVGHDVTVIGVIENVYPNATYKYIHLQLPDGGIIDDKTLNSLINTRHSFVKSLFVTTAEYLRMANETLWQPKMREFLSENHANAFDLLLFAYVMNDFQMGLAAHFQCPIVVLWVVRPALQVNGLVGNPLEMAYVPNISSHLQQPMEFLQRVKNCITTWLESALMAYLDYRTQQLYE
ncbi:UDP-glycosyltransferase UGT4-like [Bactrocera neohumeralis]|uniref:UDP-glycosyltransferase UGT4-like n=1 Tax=Bactrocera tryoni TaxID=59916 RepID=UPI001A98B25D|nr:UDP-glycosyltransferase UGT4-like [Bactrocera tryoni]XP_050330061.1 UDP-glycosyltransferase UGT4-like [Bactrocera neohumeralis]